MGDMVGKLIYGVEITPKQFKALTPKLYSVDANGYRKSRLDSDYPLILEQPYETEDHFLAIDASVKKAYNGANPIGKTITTDPDWDTLIGEFLIANDVNVNVSDAQWHVIGCYN